MTTRIPRIDRIPRRVLAPVAAVALLAGGGAAALAASGGEPAPPDRSLSQAIADTFKAPEPAGLTIEGRFVGRLVDESVRGSASGPLVDGATGTLRVGRDGRLAADVRSGGRRVQVGFDGERLTVVDHGERTAYAATAPPGAGSMLRMLGRLEPSPAMIDMALVAVRGFADVTGPAPGNVAGRPAYTVRVAPKHDGGLLGAAEIAWDPKTGTPLRVAIFAHGEREPVIDVAATSVDVGPVAADDLKVTVPRGMRTVPIDHGIPGRVAGGDRRGDRAGTGRNTRGRAGDGARRVGDRDRGASTRGTTGSDIGTLLGGPRGFGGAPVDRGASGPEAVSKAVGFDVVAPDELAGLPRRAVREVRAGNRSAALIAYGEGLGGLVVLQTKRGDEPIDLAETGLRLPELAFDGATGRELATPLGTILSVSDGEVSHLVAGSVPTAAAEAAARELVGR
ncbi:MAG: hypothetical protein AB7G37_15295 [Solirubrobacteraceae bacterium]